MTEQKLKQQVNVEGRAFIFVKPRTTQSKMNLDKGWLLLECFDEWYQIMINKKEKFHMRISPGLVRMLLADKFIEEHEG